MEKQDLNWFRKNGTTIEVFYKNQSTHIKLYDIKMEKISGASPYTPLRTFFINLVRQNSGCGARINQDALEGYRGSAAMIDYVVRFHEHLNGAFDKQFMFGGTTAVRSRVKLVQDELFNLAKSALEEKGTFNLFEVGPGYLRTQVNLITRLREAHCTTKGLKIVGADMHPEVIKAASQIIRYENIGDMVAIHEGDAKDCLTKLDTTFDAILAEGVFEYCDMEASLELGGVLRKYLKPHGCLIASATHKVPKKLLIEYLDIFVLQRSKDDFLRIFRTCGFEEPRLIPTEPPNISVGIGRKKNEK